mgnify:CR=1 FL=1|jgi:UPF0755 protein
MKRLAAYAVGASLLVLALSLLLQMLVPAAPWRTQVELRVPQGASFAQAARALAQEGLIRDERLFLALARLTGADKTLRPGHYLLSGSMSPWKVFRHLQEGRVLQHSVVIAEGDSLLEIRQKLQGLVAPEEFDRLVRDREFMASLGVPPEAPSLEGYLFPDTYRFAKGTPAKEVLSAMVRRLWQVYDQELRARTRELGLSVNEALTLASIVEKEAVVDAERPVIAGVLWNRLKRGMRLQADPTAVYGVKPFSWGVTVRDLRRRTRYNTYVIKGLPPGPIASPGLASLRAALYPEKVPYLYFVSNGDGTHTFSVSFREHLRAIQARRAND